MKTITPDELKAILEKHKKWLNNEDGGERADLCGANLRGANLCGANLCGASLRGADLRDAKIPIDLLNEFFPLACPESGAFIGWKKCGRYIVKLQITDTAKRSSAFGRKCRCSEAVVLDIQPIDTDAEDVQSVRSEHDSAFVYTKGEMVRVDDFDEDRTHECAPGIHFFITRQEAVDY